MKTAKSITISIAIAIGMTFGLAETAIANDDEIDELLEEAEELQDNLKEEEALELYHEILELDEEHYEALWNASLLTTRKYYRVEDEDDQKEGYAKALEIAEKAVDLHSDEGHSHYV
ncbi:MAG: hypothetical protein LAT80_15255, partial [Balneolaceae bacterium]|nr:hypothetical protein [Balneolaceae bacterium]